MAPLSSREQLVLKLTYYQELKLREIAEILGEPIGTVASVLSRSRERLRRKMQEIHTLERSTNGGTQ